MFKEGDRVRCIKVSRGYGTKPVIGKTYIVASVDEDRDFPLRVHCVDRYGYADKIRFLVEDFELVAPMYKPNCGKFKNSIA